MLSENALPIHLKEVAATVRELSFSIMERNATTFTFRSLAHTCVDGGCMPFLTRIHFYVHAGKYKQPESMRLTLETLKERCCEAAACFADLTLSASFANDGHMPTRL